MGHNQSELRFATETIAIAKEIAHSVYGVIAAGDVWILGYLDQATKTITSDISFFTLLDDLEDLVKTLVSIVE